MIGQKCFGEQCKADQTAITESSKYVKTAFYSAITFSAAHTNSPNDVFKY